MLQFPEQSTCDNYQYIQFPQQWKLSGIKCIVFSIDYMHVHVYIMGIA